MRSGVDFPASAMTWCTAIEGAFIAKERYPNVMLALPRIYTIQALRAVAALIVVVYHARGLSLLYQERYGIGAALLSDFSFLRDLGAFGVDVFFVISGFVMAYITWQEPREASSMGPFLKRRLIRIVPAYWLYTLVMAAALYLTSPQFAQQIDISAVIYSLLFIPYQPVGNLPAPVLAVGWTLSYEMYFYVLMALGLLCPRRAFFICLGIFFLISVAVPLFLDLPFAVLSTVTNLLVLEFYFGTLICAVYLRYGGFPRRVGWWALIAAAIMLTGCFLFMPPLVWRGLVWGLPAAGIVVFFLSREGADSFFAKPLWQALGASSYSLYLTHVIVLPAFARLAGATRLLPHVPLDVYIVVSVAVCVVVGHVLYRFVELPLSKFAGSLFFRRAKPSTNIRGA